MYLILLLLSFPLIVCIVIWFMMKFRPTYWLNETRELAAICMKLRTVSQFTIYRFLAWHQEFGATFYKSRRVHKDKNNLPFWHGLYIQRRMLHDLSGLWSCTHRSLLYPCWASTLYECQLGRTGIKVTIWPSFSPFFPWNASLTGPDQ